MYIMVGMNQRNIHLYAANPVKNMDRLIYRKLQQQH